MAKRNKQIKHTVFYVVQQLNLPSPRVSVINLKIISEKFFSMNSPEFSLKDQNFGPLQWCMASLFIEKDAEYYPTYFG